MLLIFKGWKWKYTISSHQQLFGQIFNFSMSKVEWKWGERKWNFCLHVYYKYVNFLTCCVFDSPGSRLLHSLAVSLISNIDLKCAGSSLSIHHALQEPSNSKLSKLWIKTGVWFERYSCFTRMLCTTLKVDIIVDHQEQEALWALKNYNEKLDALHSQQVIVA